MVFPDASSKDPYIGDVLVGLLGSTDLMSLRVHVDLGLALLIHFSVLQLQRAWKTRHQTQKCISYFGFMCFCKLLLFFIRKMRGTYIAGDLLDLLHVLLVWSVIRQGVSLSLGLVVLHLVDDLRNNHHRIVRSISKDTKTNKNH